MKLKLKLAALMCAVATLMTGFATTAQAQDKDIVDTAVAAGSFKTLSTHVTQREVVR